MVDFYGKNHEPYRIDKSLNSQLPVFGVLVLWSSSTRCIWCILQLLKLRDSVKHLANKDWKWCHIIRLNLPKSFKYLGFGGVSLDLLWGSFHIYSQGMNGRLGMMFESMLFFFLKISCSGSFMIPSLKLCKGILLCCDCWWLKSCTTWDVYMKPYQ